MFYITLTLFLGFFIWLILRGPKKENIKESIVPINDLTPKLTETYLTLSNIIGQHNIISYLKLHLKKALENNTALPHTIFWGIGGLGKSTLAKAVSHELGGRFIEIVPANLKSTKELFGIFIQKICGNCGLTNPFSATKCLSCRSDIVNSFTPYLHLQEKDIIFLEECHGLKQDIEEALYSLMQDNYIVVRYHGVDQRVMFPPITIIGATTKLGNLNKPFRDRFKLSIYLEPYMIADMKDIIKNYAKHCKLVITMDAVDKLAAISYGIPRIAKKYISDCATISNTVDIVSVNHILALLDIDEYGLSNIHRKIIAFIHSRMVASKNGAAGAASIASSVSITTQDYIEYYEPLLVYNEFVVQGNRGRQLTQRCKDIYFV